MIRIDNCILNRTIEEAKNSSRKRKNFNFHETLDANVQRMLNALEPGTYIQPHKHENPDKTEVFILLKGRALIIEFDDKGNVIDYSLISINDGIMGVEIKPRIWHCILSLESDTVVYEVKDGPYSPIDDKNFAPWAPREGDIECDEYMETLLKKCGF